MKEIQNKEEFQKEVLEANDLVIVDFHAIWCMPCKTLGAMLEKEFFNQHVVKVNVDLLMDIAIEYGIRSVPTVMFFLYGKPVFKSIGNNSAKVYWDALESLKDE